jgi:hypothetical protein
MRFASQLRIAIAAVTCAAVAAPAALGAGEPKNEAPFTQQAGDVAARYVAATATTDPAGEPKNQWPFTRTVQRGTASSVPTAAVTADIAGEPKNEAPFVRGISTMPVLVQTSDGFDWSDAGIGAAAALALGCVALGAFALRAGGARRPRATGA